MKKLKNRSGFSLIEMLLALGIMVLMVVGMGSGLSAGVRAYSEAIFESNSAALAGILNSAVSDVLRYSEDIEPNPQHITPESPGFKSYDGKTYYTKDKVDFVFSNYEYNAGHAFLTIGTHKAGEGTEVNSNTILQIKSLDGPTVLDLVNTGAYPDLEVRNFKVIRNHSEGADSKTYFDVSYEIWDRVETTRHRNVTYGVRLMNPEE